jgi:hypothetical protein
MGIVTESGNKTRNGNEKMNVTYAVKTKNLVTIASDTFDGWKETFAFLKAEGVEVNAKKFSDYTGETITSDMIYYYDGHPEECPVTGPSWMF